jgi:N-acetylglutamate synthase-like GNAT family acetyltransferase
VDVRFEKISDFDRGTLFKLLVQAYSFNHKWEQSLQEKWKENDNFFFDNLQVADKYAFITTLDEEPIGFAAYDPRNMPEYAIIGDNCIIPQYKGRGYGIIQLQELISRISKNDVEKIFVSTNFDLIPAQRMYEHVGFIKLDQSILEPWQIEQNCDVYYSMVVCPK